MPAAETPVAYLGIDVGKSSLDWQLHPNTSHIHPYMYG